MQAGPQNVAELFAACFTSARADRGQPALADDADAPGSVLNVLDELSLDDSRVYQQKISKWVRSSLKCVSDFFFWLLLCSAHRTRQPLLHVCRILNKSAEHGDQPIVELVGRQLQRIAAEYQELLRTFQQWTETARRESGACDAPCTRAELEVALLMLLHCAAAFDRRVARPFSRLLDLRRAALLL